MAIFNSYVSLPEDSHEGIPEWLVESVDFFDFMENPNLVCGFNQPL